MKTILTNISLIFLLIACTTEKEVTRSVGYFDLEVYNESLVEEIRVRQRVTKTVRLNEMEEVKTLTNYDMGPELAMMNKYNINKVALAGKYDEEQEGNITEYKALEDDLLTRYLSIEKIDDEVVRIEIKGLQKTVLSESRQTIIFEPKKSFLLISEDQNRYNKDLKKEVLIEY